MAGNRAQHYLGTDGLPAICPLKDGWESSSGELLEIHIQLVGLAVGEKLVPGHFALLISGHTAKHAAQSRLHTRGDLVVRLAGGDALDESALLIPVGKGE